MFTCIVIDDEKLARERITEYFKDCPKWKVVAEAGEFKEAQQAIRKYKPDACFIDINIIGGNGIELVNSLLNETDCNWVFTTAYTEYAIKAFELDATDYLLKPFENSRLDEVLDKLEKKKSVNQPMQLKSVLAVKSVGAVQFVNVQDIIWIKGSANYVELHCRDRMLLHRETLTNLERQLDPSKFLRVHRSAMVNIDSICSLSSELGRYSLLQLSNGDEVKISSAHKSTLFDTLGLEAH